MTNTSVVPEWTTWFPVATLILGYVGSSAADYFKDKRASEREQKARDDARMDRKETRYIEFVLPALVELQEATAKLARAAGKTHHLDRLAAGTSGSWGAQQLEEGVSEGFLELQTRIAILIGRVGPGRIHDLAVAFKSACVEVTIARSEAASQKALKQGIACLEELNVAIGEAFVTLNKGV